MSLLNSKLMNSIIQNRISQAVASGVQLGFDLCDINLSNDTKIEKDLIKKFIHFNNLELDNIEDIVKMYLSNDPNSEGREKINDAVLHELCCNYQNDYYAIYDACHLVDTEYCKKDYWKKEENKYNYADALHEFIYKLCHDFGNIINLNWIDVSNLRSSYFHYHIDDIVYSAGIFTRLDSDGNMMFTEEDFLKKCEGNSFNGDISQWNVSQWTDMRYMFYSTEFQGDLSQWDVSNVRDMSHMFCFSKFNDDISKWQVKNVEDMAYMFWHCRFTGDISRWDVSHCSNMKYMFACTDFNSDISNWDVSGVENMYGMFSSSVFNQDLSQWNIRKCNNMGQMFYNSKFCQDISNWVVAQDCKTDYMFSQSAILPWCIPAGIKNKKYIYG